MEGRNLVVLRVVPITLKQANGFVRGHHRHHGAVVGHKFSIGVEDEDGLLHGVAIMGRPVARGLDNGLVLEVNRLATDGSCFANSMLYSAAARIAQGMGYSRVVTYILDTEPGTSLKASGWVLDHVVRGRSWDAPNRHRTDKHPTVDKQCWIKTFGKVKWRRCSSEGEV